MARCALLDDSIPSSYFRVPIPPRSRGLIRINELNPEKITLPMIGPFIDLEAIDRLADGRIVALSERLRCIVGDQGIVAEYDYPLAEIGRRGLEGLAVRELAGGISRVAVLWEGGYPDVGSLHPQLENLIGDRTLAPLIFVHDLARNETVGRVRWNEGVAQFVLQPPKPPGDEPTAQRFRAPGPGLVRRTGNRFRPVGLSNPAQFPERRGSARILAPTGWQRFNAEGKPVGEAFDIAANTPPDIASSNWEGLSWVRRREESGPRPRRARATCSQTPTSSNCPRIGSTPRQSSQSSGNICFVGSSSGFLGRFPMK